jgi:hypothetical protein
MPRHWRVLPVLLTMLLLMGCSNRSVPTRLPTPVTVVAIVQTLPPTWTPTASWTPAPTWTPTLIPTPIATTSVQDICASFQLITSPLPAARIDFNGAATFAWKNVPDGSSMMILVAPPHGGIGIQALLTESGDGILPIPMSALPREGEYTWSVWLQHPVYGQICLHKGNFQRLSPLF